MEWIRFFTDRRRLLCLALCVALIFLLLPLGSLQRAELTDPIGNDPLPELEPIRLGEGRQQSAESDQIPETLPPETEPNEVPETIPSETKPNEIPETRPDTGDGDEGREDGNRGEEGGEEPPAELSLILTWQRYGNQPSSIACSPSESVTKTLNTAQLRNHELKYAFSIRSEEEASIETVRVKVGDAEYQSISADGSIFIELPEGGTRDYTFLITARTEAGETVAFTIVLNCIHTVDLELVLSWQERDGSTDDLRCAPNGTAAKTVKSRDLTEHVFSYTPALTGAAAGGAKLTKGSYTTDSGESGELSATGGTLALKTGGTYYLTFEAETEDMTLFFRFTIDYTQAADVSLRFTWLERGSTPRTLLCQPGGTVSTDVRSNQLSAGAVKYEIELSGDDAANARILNISYTSATGGGKLERSGSIPMSIPAGAAENTCTVIVSVLVNGEQLRYEISLHLSMDVSLEMSYRLQNGEMRTILCENGKTRTAEPIYDDELADGLLRYSMKLASTAGEGLSITGIQCYQSGSGRTVKLDAEDSLTLLLKNGKTGENTFTVTAADTDGTAYSFTIAIPYKHRGERTVKISSSLRDGQTIINGAEGNLSVAAWTEDGAGNVTGYIPANGTDTKLIVTFDGERIPCVSSSGNASEYILIPQNPDVGDENEHILNIYAEDAYGNYGELTIRLKGRRNQSGQKTGTATIYVDMSVVGLGIVDSVRYDVLADEPISYSIGKAVFGMDLGEPYGAAKDTLGWKAKYLGTLDEGFYLQSLTPGVSGRTLNGSAWSQYGGSEAEILSAIDAQFGKGTGLATLWRCIYRNGLNKSGGSGGTYGEFDYTSGSGWLFSLNGTYYPGLSMCQYSLEDGDVLTLRYSLAYGWDVGGGTKAYGNTAGYCVTALNGSYAIDHRMETVELEDGSLRYQCRSCGLVEECAHANAVCTDLGDGTHVRFCNDCRTMIGDPEEHIWDQQDAFHICTACGCGEEHRWKEVEGSNTATCTEAGTRTVFCTVCELVREEESPPRGHALNSRWNHTKTEHYQKCSVCLQIIPQSVGAHQYEYHAGDNDWYCTVCEAGHDWDYCGNAALTIQSASCVRIVFHCAECGLDLTQNGTFDEYHTFDSGSCTVCGKPDPNYIPPTEPPVTEPPVTEPPVTEPPIPEPPETEAPTRKNRRNNYES